MALAVNARQHVGSLRFTSARTSTRQSCTGRRVVPVDGLCHQRFKDILKRLVLTCGVRLQHTDPDLMCASLAAALHT